MNKKEKIGFAIDISISFVIGIIVGAILF